MIRPIYRVEVVDLDDQGEDKRTVTYYRARGEATAAFDMAVRCAYGWVRLERIDPRQVDLADLLNDQPISGPGIRVLSRTAEAF